MKFSLIVNPNLGYLYFLKTRQLDKWGFKEVQNVKSLTEIEGKSLFGETLPYYIEISNKSMATDLVKELTNLGAERLESKLSGGGLLIGCTCNLVISKSLQKTVKELGGTVDARSKNDQNSFSEELFEGVKVKDDVKEFLLEWAGQDRNKPIGVVSWLRSLTESQQKRVTVNNVSMQMIGEKGEVAPFIASEIFEGNYIKAIEHSRRSLPLLIVAVLKKKLTQMYRLAVINDNNEQIPATDLYKMLGVSKGAFFYLSKDVKKFTAYQIYSMLKMVMRFEDDVKTGNVISPQDSLELLILKMSNVCKPMR